MNITVISYPSNEINFTEDVGDSLNSSELVKYMWVDVSEAPTDEYIEITYNGETITLLIEEECRYTPIDIFFQNKEGAEQVLTFFKAQSESISITSEEYQANTGQANLGNHQYNRFNVQARTKFKVNSGFVDETMNETFKQLLLSRKVWKYENGIFTPLNITTSSLEYKTRQKDRLINYEIEFTNAFNELNSI
jgi:hypothetical protein